MEPRGPQTAESSTRRLPSTEGDPPTLRGAWSLLVRLLRLIRAYWGAIGRGIGLGLAAGLVGLIPPYVSKLLIDEVYPTHDVTLMQVLVGGVLAITITTSAMGAIRNYYGQVIGAEVSSAATLMFFNHIQHLPVRFFDRHRVGEIMSRFQDLTGSLGALNRIFETVLLRGVYLLLVPPVLFLLNWKLALLSIVTLPLTSTIAGLTARVLRRYWKASAESYADLSAYQVETLTQIRTIRTFAAEHRVFREAETQLRSALHLRLKAGGVGILIGVVNGVIRAGGLALFTWFGWTLILHGDLTLGAYIAFTSYQGYLVGPLSQFAGLFVSFQQTAVTLARTFEYLDEAPEQDPALAFAPPPPIRHRLRGALTLEGVSFGYAPDARVLHLVDLEIPAGSTMALVGPSGAGKSSLFRLLCRIDDPDGGTIRADGMPLFAIALPDLRRQVAVVWQEVALIRGTLWDNLTLGVEATNDAAVEAVVRACRLDCLLAELPEGYHTPVAEWGATLSGGQRQRIAIARALLCDTPILLLDEATSNLDSETEQAVLRELFARVPRRTVVFATHRLATAALADRIAVLEEGRIVGLGTHAELLSHCTTYCDLHGLRRGAPIRRTPLPLAGN